MREIETIEKELVKYQKLATNLDREIASNEGKLDSILEQIKKDFGVISIDEADKTLDELEKQVVILEAEINKQVEELGEKYGHLVK